MIDTTGMSLQQVSDAIAGKVIAQGGRCMDRLTANSSCAYSDGNGNHCAIGWLLSESSPIMQHRAPLSAIIKVYEFNNEPNREFILDNIDALINIQVLHDNPLLRVSRSEFIAETYGLNMAAWSEWAEMGAS